MTSEMLKRKEDSKQSQRRTQSISKSRTLGAKPATPTSPTSPLPPIRAAILDHRKMDYEPDPFIDDFDEDERVCLACLTDAGLRKAFGRSSDKEQNDCSFCGSEGRETVPALEIQALIKNRCLDGKNEAANELSYCTREGGYIGRTYESHELFESLTLHAVGDEFYAALEKKLNVWSLFCNWDHDMPQPTEQWRYGWQGFVDTVKHKCRFFFGEHMHETRDEFDHTEISPNDFLRNHVPQGIERLQAVQTLPAGTIFYRCRISEPNTPVEDMSQIGPRPATDSENSNRFSPPGIVMFYAGDTQEISAVEVGWPDSSSCDGNVLHTGKLRTMTDLTVLDFTNLAYPAGNFDPDWLDDYHIAQFFREFIRDLSAPVLDQRKPLDYVPTQVLCEYFRFYGAKSGGKWRKLDGIRYPSSHDGTPCYVFFWDNELAREKLQLESMAAKPSPRPARPSTS